MNNFLPNWNFESDLSVNTQKKPLGRDHELVELLWRNGQVVFHSQKHQKSVGCTNDARHVEKHEHLIPRACGTIGNSGGLIQEDETVSWIQYPVEDSLEKEFCSNFLFELPCPEGETDKPFRQFEEGKFFNLGNTSVVTHVAASSKPPLMKSLISQDLRVNPMPPPKTRFPESSQQSQDLGELGKAVNFSHFATPSKGVSGSSSGQFGEKGIGVLEQGEARDCSVMTVGSSHCGSSLVPQDTGLGRATSNGARATALSDEIPKDNNRTTIPQTEKGKAETTEPTTTSYSGGSGSSFGRCSSQSTGIHDHKRKGREAEEYEDQSEATEQKSTFANTTTVRTRCSRRTRAAEVHNLSERRRRDRINKKMKDLQELIPHCTKTDKASMLDEAIEYLKSLQLQLQVMWMGTGMAPIMFPGVQQYTSQMGVGMGPPSLPQILNPMHLPRVPIVDQSISVGQPPNQHIMCPTPVMNPVNYQNQMQNSALSEQYAHYMGFHLMQNASQPMNVYRFGSQPVQLGQTMIQPNNSGAPVNGGTNTNDAISGKMG